MYFATYINYCISKEVRIWNSTLDFKLLKNGWQRLILRWLYYCIIAIWWIDMYMQKTTTCRLHYCHLLFSPSSNFIYVSIWLWNPMWYKQVSCVDLFWGTNFQTCHSIGWELCIIQFGIVHRRKYRDYSCSVQFHSEIYKEHLEM